jgi:glycosyltransferase involved in cell wall biosynthesis
MKEFDVCMIAFVDIATDARTLNISGSLAKHGYTVAVIGTGDIPHKENPNITYFQIPVNNKKKTRQRWWEFYQNTKSLSKTIKTKTVFAEDVYSLPTASKLAKRNKSKLIYDSREIYSAIGPLSGKSFRQKFIEIIEKKYIKNVNGIIVTAERDAEYLTQHLSDKIPYTIIKNLPPYKDRIHSDIIREKYSLSKETRIILYQGMLLGGRGIEKTINTVADIDKCAFVILGEGPLRGAIRELIKNKNLSDRVFLAGAIEYSELHKWTCSADLGIALIEPVSKSYELALPNKLFEYIMARIPTLCSNLPAMKEVIEKYDTGKYIDYNAPQEEFARAISEIIDNKAEYIKKCEQAARELSFERQDYQLSELIK